VTERKYRTDTPVFLTRLREKTKQKQKQKNDTDRYNKIYSELAYYKKSISLRWHVFFTVLILFFGLAYFLIWKENTRKDNNLINNIELHIDSEVISKNISPPSTSLNNIHNTDLIIESTVDKATETNNESSIISSFSALLLDKIFSNKEINEEKRSLFNEAVTNFVNGFSSRAGSKSFDSMINFFKVKTFSSNNLKVIYFNKDKYKLSRSGINKINTLCTSFNDFSGPITISGHADSTGNHNHNKVLIDNRIKIVRDKIKDNCQKYEGKFKLVNNLANPAISTTSDYSEPENRVVIIKY
jgi:outer membrane protein OmpA-like peptidoglycan-associated protein